MKAVWTSLDQIFTTKQKQIKEKNSGEKNVLFKQHLSLLHQKKTCIILINEHGPQARLK